MLVLVLIFSMTACGTSEKTSDTNKNDATSEGETVYVENPINIEFWHTFGSGEAAKYINEAVETFNKTNEYGITVNALSMGDYVSLRTSLTTAIGAGDNPQVSILGMSDILASAGVLQDMSAYAKRDEYLVENFIDGVDVSMYCNEQLTALPFARSCSVFVYNADMFAEAGYDTAPTTIAELEEMCSAVSKKLGVYGFQMNIGPSYEQEALLLSLGSEGLIDLDREGASCLDDGTMLKLLEDWESWCVEGWCARPNVTDTASAMYRMLYNKQLASCIISSGSLMSMLETAEESGINLKVAAMPGYNGTCGVRGGADISIISANNDEQQIAAAWEFVKFMMSDEQIALRCDVTGYMPITEKSAELCDDLFAKYPGFKASYEAGLECEDTPGCIQRSEWQTQAQIAMSYVIQDKSMTAKEAVEYMKSLLPTVFY